MVEVTILIPTYYGGQMLYNCIDSIHKHVKNPRILTYKNDEGWLKAANKMMQSVSTDVILLNDDTIVISDIVEEMRSYAYMGNKYNRYLTLKTGIIGGKSLMPDGQTIINYGIYVGTDGNTGHKYYGKSKNEVPPMQVQKAVEGSCIYLRRDMLDEIGYFDENYGMGYREEVDLCFRAREAGWVVLSVATAEYIHLTSQTNSRLGITNDTHDYFMEKWGSKLLLGKV